VKSLSIKTITLNKVVNTGVEKLKNKTFQTKLLIGQIKTNERRARTATNSN
jgi:hypothetical protein